MRFVSNRAARKRQTQHIVLFEAANTTSDHGGPKTAFEQALDRQLEDHDSLSGLGLFDVNDP